jgi:hypothetical protein
MDLPNFTPCHTLPRNLSEYSGSDDVSHITGGAELIMGLQ